MDAMHMAGLAHARDLYLFLPLVRWLARAKFHFQAGRSRIRRSIRTHNPDLYRDLSQERRKAPMAVGKEEGLS